MMGKVVDVCAIIVTFNRADMLLKCLKSLEAGSDVPQSLVIFDNGSSDDTLAMLCGYQLAWSGDGAINSQHIEIYKKPGIAVLHSSANFGGAGGFFGALKYAHILEAAIITGLWMMMAQSVERPFHELKVHSAVDMITNSLVIDHNDDDQLAFGLMVDGVHCSTRQELHMARATRLSSTP